MLLDKIPGIDETAEKYGVDETAICPGEHRAMIKSLQRTTAAHFKAGTQWCERERVSVAIEALRFYNHPVYYHTHHKNGHGLQKSDDNLSGMDIDSGEKAREALAKLGEW